VTGRDLAGTAAPGAGPADERPYRIVFVCLGNICRSPMAEIATRALLAESPTHRRIDVASAGTGDYHLGEPADDRAAATLRSRGYDPAAHRARQFSSGDFAAADLVVALDRSNAADLRRLARSPAEADKIRLLRSFDPVAVQSGELDVPDAYFGGDDGFEVTLDLVEAACRALIDQVTARSPGRP
jgi:protein-tyrosine phosphatase